METKTASRRTILDKIPTIVRVLILIITLVGIVLTWHHYIWIAIAKKSQMAAITLKSANTDITTLQIQLDQLTTALKTKKTELSTAATQSIGSGQIELISPNDMRELLESILTNKYRMVLLSFQNLPMKIVLTPQQNFRLYEYGIVMKFQGDFFTTMKYLRDIESLKWRLFWDRFDYKVTKYPLAEVTLQIHTLSDQEGWVHA